MKHLLAALFLLIGLTSQAWATKTEDTFVDGGAPISLPSHTPTGGGSWTLKFGTSFSGGSAGTGIQTSGQVRAYSSSNVRHAAADTATDDQYAQFTVGTTPSDGWFVILRDASGTNSTASGIAFDLVCGNTSYVGDMSGDSYTTYSPSTNPVTCSTGDAFKITVTGTTVQAQKCPGGTSCSTIPGMTFTTTNYTTGKHIAFQSRSVLTNAITYWISDDNSTNSIGIDEPPGTTGTGWRKTNQVLPTDVGQTYGTVTFTGSYTGTAGTNVDLRFCADSGCSSVLQTWTTCTTTATISGGIWSCPMHVQAAWTSSSMAHVQVRWTNITGTFSPSATTGTMGVGAVVALLGQSQLAHMFVFSSQFQDCTTTSGSSAVSSGQIANQGIATNFLDGYSLTGTNIPSSQTVTGPYNAGAGSFHITPGTATGTSSTGTCNLEVTPGTPNSVAWRFQGGSAVTVYPVADPPHTNEGSYGDMLVGAPNGNTEGTIQLSSNLSTVSGGATMQLEFASSGTSICFWISTTCRGGLSNGNYTQFTGSQGVSVVGSDFNAVPWAQGGTDALMMIQVVTGAADNGSGKIRLTFSSTPTGAAMWTTGDTATVSGITGSGVPACLNTAQTITVIDNSHIDLPGCSSAGFSYISGGQVTNYSTTQYSTYLQNVKTWVQSYRASAPFMVIPIGTFVGDFTPENYYAVEAMRQAHLACIDSGGCVWGGGEIDLEHEDTYHLSPKGRIQYAKRIAKAYDKAVNGATSGYGPKISGGSYSGNVLRVAITQEGAATLTCGNLSTSCSAITGFRVYKNGVLQTISSTALVQPGFIDITCSSTLSGTVTFDYQAGQNPNVSNAVYDNQAPYGDTQGLPLQPSRGLVTASFSGGGFFLRQPFGMAENENETYKKVALK